MEVILRFPNVMIFSFFSSTFNTRFSKIILSSGFSRSRLINFTLILKNFMNQLGAQQMQTEMYCVRHNIREAEDKEFRLHTMRLVKNLLQPYLSFFVIFTTCFVQSTLQPKRRTKGRSWRF